MAVLATVYTVLSSTSTLVPSCQGFGSDSKGNGIILSSLMVLLIDKATYEVIKVRFAFVVGLECNSNKGVVGFS